MMEVETLREEFLEFVNFSGDLLDWKTWKLLVLAFAYM